MSLDRWRSAVICGAFSLMILGVAPLARAQKQDAGQVKVVKGTVRVERAGKAMPAQVGLKVREGDSVITGPDGSVGITFADDSLLSLGPRSAITIEKFAFDSTTHAGSFETKLTNGTLAAVSGKLTRQTPGAMTVKTPQYIAAVRGTEFLVRAGER